MTAQGSRNGPLSWAVFAAHSGRLCQSLFFKEKHDLALHRSAKNQILSRFFLRLNIYVDDPVAGVRGTKKQRDRDLVVLVLCWVLLGFRLQISKAQRGRSIEWTGADFQVYPDRVVTTIPQEKVEDLTELLNQFRARNVVAQKDLRSFIGKTVHVSILILAWRPFVNELWAALLSIGTERCSGAPPGCCWTSQCDSAFLWMLAFLNPSRNPNLLPGTGIVRVYSLASYLGVGHEVSMTLDASPFGLGAWLEVEGKIIRFIESPLDSLDEARFQCKRGVSAGQQIWEGFIALVALRAWKAFWFKRRIKLKVRSDNMSALSLLISLRVRGPGLNLIGRELSLELGDCAFIPSIIEHLPGVANDLSDILSRRTDPKKQPWVFPAVLAEVERTDVPLRDDSYFLSVREPPQSR